VGGDAVVVATGDSLTEGGVSLITGRSRIGGVTSPGPRALFALAPSVGSGGVFTAAFEINISLVALVTDANCAACTTSTATSTFACV
jgi:hypothetical protein